MAHGPVHKRREKKSYSYLFQTLLDCRFVSFNVNAKTLQHVGASRPARNSTITMLRHGGTGPGHDERDSGRNIKRIGPVAPGAAGIDYRVDINGQLFRLVAHNLCRTDNFRDTFPLHFECGEECSQL